jgi:hypothetical protein
MIGRKVETALPDRARKSLIATITEQNGEPRIIIPGSATRWLAADCHRQHRRCDECQ